MDSNAPHDSALGVPPADGPLRVFFLGTTLAGRGTTVRCLLETQRPVRALSAPFDASGGWELPWTHGAQALQVSLRPKNRTAVIYDPLRDQALAPEYRDEASFMRDAHGFVFVADAQPARREANEESLAAFEGFLRRLGRAPSETPVVFQINKVDLLGDGSPAPIAAMSRWARSRIVPTTASSAWNVAKVLDELVSLVRTT